MSISPDSAAAVVCREVFDETSHPSNEEVYEHAKRLGIDPNAEPHLLDLAREGLMAALPEGWSPVYHGSTNCYYYYQASTGISSWEHPLDAAYRELVKQARAGNSRQTSVEDDSKTTAKDLESHEEATLPKEPAKEPEKNADKPPLPVPTRIPTKLAPLKRPERGDSLWKKSPSIEKASFKRDSPRSEFPNPLATDRTSRDYTNLRFQDPKFYECPKVISAATTPTSTSANPPTKELDLTEVLKRSETLSPRHEKDWEQLSSKFTSEENIIDIDKLSASSLSKSERPEKEKFEKEKHHSQFGQPKELTLNGGGSMFLKSNRSRDTTPSQDEGKLDDFRALAISEEASSIVGDRLKSILREKQPEDDEEPLDEERKRVRFDLEKEVDIKFMYSGSEDEWDSESEGPNLKISATLTNKVTGTVHYSPKPTSQSLDDEINSDRETKEEALPKKSFSLEKLDSVFMKSSKVVGRRFLVQNVTENEHRSQMTQESLSRDSSLDFVPNKFENVKNIDLVSKSDTDSSILRNSDSDEYRRTKSKKSPIRFAEDVNEEEESSRANHQPEANDKINLEEVRSKLRKEHENGVAALKKEYDGKLQETRKEVEEKYIEQKVVLEKNLADKLEALKREMTEKEEQEIQKLIAEMDEARLENLKKVKTELEACYEKERHGILANLKTELDERKRELLELRNQEMGKLETEHERDLSEEKLAQLSELELTKAHAEKIEALKKELEKELEDLKVNLRMQQREKITKITEDHEKCLAEILRDFKIDEGLARKMYKQRLEEVRADIQRSAEKEAKRQLEQNQQQDNADFEKMRCEKRLLQDKYTALKGKYMRLKNDVRLAVERRSKKKEGYTTTSETEMSASTRTRTDRTDRTESTDQNTSLRNVCSLSSTASKSQEVQTASEPVAKGYSMIDEPRGPPTNQSSISNLCQSSGAKCETDDTITASESHLLSERKSRPIRRRSLTPSKPAADAPASPANGNLNLNNNNNNNDDLENPVENIRKQLKKLEDLGDQLPSNETAYTLRYPFQDKAPANASSELEFFRHRLHVEKDSVRRAREALKHQRNAFQGRQRAWKQRSARATLEQLVQEERELSDMEVSLHRTRSLLGEKVIHLRHLEQSLERVASANTKRSNESDGASTKNDELTLSDMSSASSGFSSTDLGTDTFIDKPDHYSESTEIVAILENLNSEIREIWGVLNKRQNSNIPRPPMMQSYLRWLRFHQLTMQALNVQRTFGTPNIQSNILSQLTPQTPATTTQNIIAQYGPNSGFTTSVGTVDRGASNVMERTRNLRDWLRQARVQATDLVSPGQATL